MLINGFRFIWLTPRYAISKTSLCLDILWVIYIHNIQQCSQVGYYLPLPERRGAEEPEPEPEPDFLPPAAVHDEGC